MTLEEEVDRERKHYESDRAWLIRRTFLRKYWTEVPRDQLLCLSQLFINVNMIGCVYSDAVMEKVRKMGSGIMEKANSLYLENQSRTSMNGNVAPIKAAPTTTPDRPKVVPNLPRNPTRVNSEDSYIEEKMKQIKIYLLQADYRASAMEMLNQATGRARSPWTKQVSDGVMRISIANILIFQHKFEQPNIDWTECAVNAVVETFLHGENIMVKDKMLHFSGSGPQDLYCNFLRRCLKKAEKLAVGVKTFKALHMALEKVNLELSQHSTHLQGWSQKVDIRIGDLLASTRVLSKGECVRAKLDNAIDEMCAKISEIIARGSPNIVLTEHGLELR